MRLQRGKQENITTAYKKQHFDNHYGLRGSLYKEYHRLDICSKKFLAMSRSREILL